MRKNDIQLKISFTANNMVCLGGDIRALSHPTNLPSAGPYPPSPSAYILQLLVLLKIACKIDHCLLKLREPSRPISS